MSSVDPNLLLIPWRKVKSVISADENEYPHYFIINVMKHFLHRECALTELYSLIFVLSCRNGKRQVASLLVVLVQHRMSQAF